MKYSVLIEPTRTGFCGQVMDIDGLYAVGDTPEEVRGLLRDILVERIEELRAEGKPVPPACTLCDTVEVA